MIPQGTAQEITRQSKSNLAFALQCLPKDRRDDLVVFYAFCRVIDDIADDLQASVEEKAKGLNHWKHGITEGFAEPTALEAQVISMRGKYDIPVKLFVDLIEGCEMDLTSQLYQTWDDLQGYTYRVACVVGLISLYIFGADPDRAREYAIHLGHALQLTNILRDVGEDLDNEGRIYLPIEECEKFSYSEADLRGKVYDDRFTKVMKFQSERAEELYQKAAQILKKLPKEDVQALKSARIMGDIYSSVLKKIKADNFRVFHQRHSISKGKKVYLLLKGMIIY